MGENARFKNGQARVETRILKTLVCRTMSEASFSIGRQSVSVRLKRACRQNAFKHFYAEKSPRPIKIKSALPPPPQKPKIPPPPLKRGILWTWVFCRNKNALFQASIKLAQPFEMISSPRVADKNSKNPKWGRQTGVRQSPPYRR